MIEWPRWYISIFDGLVDAGGDARGGADGVDKLEAEGEDGREEEGGDEDLDMRVKVKAW